ncbi:hypothetical protein HMPREF6485_2682 [Segatella buccae ATCC 33574]|uniref:Uncharacterized protein n=1 Tax=Segatella buccae ATCC 33574 TaxID=873513 RepID=E6KAP6_9BACT|nr:hypothetical protein HMPREF6485_2682 [Segatella buccae ATCC 33574]
MAALLYKRWAVCRFGIGASTAHNSSTCQLVYSSTRLLVNSFTRLLANS